MLVIVTNVHIFVGFDKVGFSLLLLSLQRTTKYIIIVPKNKGVLKQHALSGCLRTFFFLKKQKNEGFLFAFDEK